MYWVVPHVDNPEKFHVSRLHWEQDGEEQIESYIATRWPERADMVEFRLKCYGLPKPCDADWKSKKAEGLPRPFGADENHGKFQIVGKDGRERWLQDAP